MWALSGLRSLLNEQYYTQLYPSTLLNAAMSGMESTGTTYGQYNQAHREGLRQSALQICPQYLLLYKTQVSFTRADSKLEQPH